jgi:branched-chain amino acid transport system substrate-binding protein
MTPVPREKASAALAAALALGFTASASADTIKIGVVLPYSGVNAALGNQIDKAFDLYLKLHANDLVQRQPIASADG